MTLPPQDMPPDHESRLRACAEVIVRVGLNLRPGQRLIIAEPYELQGVSPDASGLVEAVSVAVMEMGSPRPAVIWGDSPRLRHYAKQADWRGFTRLVAANAEQMKQHLAGGGAFLFPISSFSQLMAGIAAKHISELQRISWEHFGPIIQRLTRGESQWTLVPAPTPAWAETAFADLSAGQRFGALQDAVHAALRIDNIQSPVAPAISDWQSHLTTLGQRRDELNSRRHKTIRYQGPGTDLTLKLPTQHQWCTAQLTTKSGINFVANLPTEEVFTAPDKNSAEGMVRVARPVNCSGAVIEGIELEFKQGRVVTARARTGSELLQRLLETDAGACRLGEVAMIINETGSDSRSAPAAAGPGLPRANWQNSGRLFYHTLLDENASNHIALGESYHFCSRSLLGFGLNRSLVHVDLPLDARITLT